MVESNAFLESNYNRQPFSCKYCDKSFDQFKEVKDHIKIHAHTLRSIEPVESTKSAKNLEISIQDQSDTNSSKNMMNVV